MKIQWNKVTWYSWTLTAIVFLVLLPALTYYFLDRYAEVVQLNVTTSNNNSSLQTRQANQNLYTIKDTDLIGEWDWLHGYGQDKINTVYKFSLKGDKHTFEFYNIFHAYNDGTPQSTSTIDTSCTWNTSNNTLSIICPNSDDWEGFASNTIAISGNEMTIPDPGDAGNDNIIIPVFVKQVTDSGMPNNGENQEVAHKSSTLETQLAGTGWEEDIPKQPGLWTSDLKEWQDNPNMQLITSHEIDFATTTENDPKHKKFDFEEYSATGNIGSGYWSIAEGDLLTVIDSNSYTQYGSLVINIQGTAVIKGNKLIIKDSNPNGTTTTYTKI